ncbi:hypothetical protein IFT66_00025 [Rhizobium sp. CFBP 13726]|uniref:hypothetical protein n=1 Tax=Rhizobium sp. CFBP 13726 TaxID=2775296 RepID=UPI00177F103D|nr:hypothetical protein [Rhizobium sp. CFBP 13726]MBD8649459.1 hypothetical protein [Rhizobium sp. CFBP 13726]
MAIKRNRSRKRDGRHDGADDWDKLTSLQEALLREAAREITIASNGRTDTVRMDEVVTRKMMQMAANGGQHSISNAIYQINMAQRLRQKKADEDVAFGHQFKTHQQHLLDAARKRGQDLATVLPHPDDIIVEEGVGYALIGPIDETELRRVKRDCERRDAAILQAALEKRLGPLAPGISQEPSNHPADASALLVVQVLNDALPKRFRKTDLQIAMDLMQYNGVTKRELLKRSHQQWAALGKPKPRGWRLPPVETVISTLQRVLPAMIALYPEVKSGKLSVEAIAIKLQRMSGSEPIG